MVDAVVTLKGHMMRFQVFLSLWSVTSCSCIDKILEVAKTKVSKPKRYSLSKLRLCHAPLKQLIQTRPHMSTSLCGNIYIMQPKVSRRKQKHFIWPSESRLGIIKITYNRKATHFMDDRFVNQGGGNYGFAMTILHF